jgi:RND superfamily putative drug exporter
MIFAFLFGLSMDYEVFMLSRRLILMFAFLVLSTTPGFEIKQLAIGLAAGIIIDATVIRALLVPAPMRLMGAANWWLPGPPAIRGSVRA